MNNKEHGNLDIVSYRDCESFLYELCRSADTDRRRRASLENYRVADWKSRPSSLLYVAQIEGRYREPFDYSIVTEFGVPVSGAGFYPHDRETVILMSRTYSVPGVRHRFLATNILQDHVWRSRELGFRRAWITVNEYNLELYHEISRANQADHSRRRYPDIWYRFRPVGRRTIKNTEQWIVELEL